MTTATLIVTTPTDTTIVMTRAFHAPRRLLWQAMTDPAKLRRWLFAPPGITMSVCQFDPRIGGQYNWVWKSQHADPWMTIRGRITDLLPHERIVYTQIMEMAPPEPAAELTVMHEFSESGGITRMRLTLTFPSKAARDRALKWRMETGMEISYQQLDELLDQMA